MGKRRTALGRRQKSNSRKTAKRLEIKHLRLAALKKKRNR